VGDVHLFFREEHRVSAAAELSEYVQLLQVSFDFNSKGEKRVKREGKRKRGGGNPGNETKRIAHVDKQE
jgi:hypothetical protein